ncbi:hypothetical protein Q5M85_07475 [Paraclostridium bifermentans]|nr:hypothetical protein [Paraclostridium bifermentans]
MRSFMKQFKPDNFEGYSSRNIFIQTRTYGSIPVYINNKK